MKLFILLILAVIIITIVMVVVFTKKKKEKYYQDGNLKVQIFNNSKILEGGQIFIIRVQLDNLDLIQNNEPYAILESGEVKPLTLFYSYFKDTTHKGQMSAGYDQFTVYYTFSSTIPTDTPAPNALLKVREFVIQNLQESVYWSINYDNQAMMNRYISITNLKNYSTKYFNKDQPILNPYEVGVKNTCCYGNLVSSLPKPTSQPVTSFCPTANNGGLDVSMGTQCLVYRADRQTSQGFGQEGGIPGECADSYLFTVIPSTSAFGFIEMFLPTFYSTKDGCENNSDNSLDLYYFSITSGQNNDASNWLPFWSVNGTMMKETANRENYSYVFWGPIEYVKERKNNPLPGDIVTPSWAPPLVQLGNCQYGYMLGFPTYTFLFRNRGPNKNWEGYIGNAPCYLTLNETLSHPITDQLGPYCPVIYGYENVESLNELFSI